MHVHCEQPLPAGVCLAAIRVWQWTSSLLVAASTFSLLHGHMPVATPRPPAVQVLGLVSFVYATVVVCCVHGFRTLGFRSWRIAAAASVPGDLAMMGVCLAIVAILDRHAFTRGRYDTNELVLQPTAQFASWSADMPQKLDSRLCAFPRTVYGLSVVAIFSHTFSILLSVLCLQQHKTGILDPEKTVDGHRAASMHAPSILDNDSVPSRTSLHQPSRPPSPPYGPLYPSSSSSSRTSLSEWRATTVASGSKDSSDTDSVMSRTSLPPSYPPGTPPTANQRRWSTSTSSSYNATAFIVTDGFRPSGDSSHPPAYSSRPGSLYHENMKYEAGLMFGGQPPP